jgi:AAA domain, putative AbiEii toxin, Type IV TA system
MKLKFVRPFESITSLNTEAIEFPKFTVITGLNGSGKSQLLLSIRARFVECSVANLPDEAILFNGQNFIIIDCEPIVTEDSSKNRVQYFNRINQLLPLSSPLKMFWSNYCLGIKGEVVEEQLFNDPLTWEINQVPSVIYSQQDSAKLQNLKSLLSAGGLDEKGDGSALKQLFHLAKKTGKKSIFDLTQDEVAADMFDPAVTNPYQLSFTGLFEQYRQFKTQYALRNGLGLSQEGDFGKLANIQFEKEYGQPPWSIVNDILADLQMPFKISEPNFLQYKLAYTPRVIKIDTGIELPFSSLSSGEKILMSLAVCRYYQKEVRLNPVYPKLLLLDEVDAPLHPSMTKNLISIIQDTLIAKQGLHVILTTHSPSTVALAPDDSIHIMQTDGERLRKATKAEALNLLTDGVPTLSINFEGQRQVLVESPFDAAICAKLYELFKSKLPSGRSLEFISLGFRNSETGSDENTGVDKLLLVLNSFIEAGNRSVFALVDSDKVKREPDPNKRIQVFAKGKRDGLENCIYDPLILLLFIARHAPDELAKLEISHTFVDTQISNLKVSEIQAMVDKIQTIIIGEVNENAEFAYVEYNGGLSLKIRMDYLRFDDHCLQTEILENKMNFLKKIASNNVCASQLAIVAGTMAAYPDYVPLDLFETFKDLLVWDAHI